MSVAVRRCEDAADKQRSLEIYNDAVPRRAVTPELAASWEQAWRETGFELDVRTATSSADAPAGIEIVSLDDRPELATQVYDVAVEAMPDVPGHEDWRAPERERFARTHVHGPHSLVIVALAEDE